MVLEVLKYILIVLGIVAVAVCIISALANLVLAIFDPHSKQSKNEQQVVNQQQIIYEQPKLLENKPVEQKEETREDVKDVDLEKAKEEELALSQANSFATLSEEEDAFIKEKQKNIEERLAAKNVQEETEDEINLDEIFVDSNDEKVEEVKEEPVEDDEDDEDIEALINRILAESGEDEDEEAKVEEIAEDVAEEPVQEEVIEEPVQEESTQELNAVEEETAQEIDQVEEQIEEQENNEAEERIKALEEELARQKEEYENRLAIEKQEQENVTNERIEELERQLAEKEKQLADAANVQSGAALSLEEYEARLEVLKDRLAANDKELRVVKKEYLPLAKIKKSWEKDKVKLRRKEALVAKQKVVLYGVNNYVDIDEEKAKKLAEELDLLDGLRLSVQHCEEVMKANEERYPILENSYNILLANNENIKADIAECTSKIEELKASKQDGEQE